jgi:hypothetical protein
MTLLFAVSGGLSANLLLRRDATQLCIFQCPFLLLCLFVFGPQSKRGLVWVAAWILWPTVALVTFITGGFAPPPLGDYISSILAGQFGGFGLSVCNSFAHRHWRGIAGGVLVGGLAAFPVGLWLGPVLGSISPEFTSSQVVHLRYALAIWQGAMGAYLCAISRSDVSQARKKNAPDRLS